MEKQFYHTIEEKEGKTHWYILLVNFPLDYVAPSDEFVFRKQFGIDAINWDHKELFLTNTPDVIEAKKFTFAISKYQNGLKDLVFFFILPLSLKKFTSLLGFILAQKGEKAKSTFYELKNPYKIKNN